MRSARNANPVLSDMIRSLAAVTANVIHSERKMETRLAMLCPDSAPVKIILVEGSARNVEPDFMESPHARSVSVMRPGLPRRNAIRIMENVFAR